MLIYWPTIAPQLGCVQPHASGATLKNERQENSHPRRDGNQSDAGLDLRMSRLSNAGREQSLHKARPAISIARRIALDSER